MLLIEIMTIFYAFFDYLLLVALALATINDFNIEPLSGSTETSSI